jgi:serine/threonine-protein kinase
VHTRLSHPNIVAFHDAPELDGCVVMTTEFVEGTTLAELCRPGPLLSSEALRIICAVLSGLEEAHALGIVHRGITAEHVKVTPGGDVKLGGFDLAKPEADVMLTKGGLVLGDPRYISPEQVTGTEALDGRADVYSVGVLLFQTLTGKVPFDSPNDYDTMVAQVGKQPPRPSRLNPGIAPELDEIVLTALAKEPENRYAGAWEFRMALESLECPVGTTQEAEEAEPEVRVPQFLVQAEGGGPGRTALVIGLVGVAIGLIVLVLVAMHGV